MVFLKMSFCFQNFITPSSIEVTSSFGDTGLNILRLLMTNTITKTLIPTGTSVMLAVPP
jgi:hypothetical protein